MSTSLLSPTAPAVHRRRPQSSRPGSLLTLQQLHKKTATSPDHQLISLNEAERPSTAATTVNLKRVISPKLQQQPQQWTMAREDFLRTLYSPHAHTNAAKITTAR